MWITCSLTHLLNRFPNLNLSLRHQAGSVLVIVIWIVTVLVIFVVGLSALVASRLNTFKYFRDTNRAYFVALGAVNKAIAEVNKEAKISWYDSLSEPWSNNPLEFQEILIGGGVGRVSYEYPTPAGATENITFYGAADEERRININKVNATVLQTLLVKVGEVETNKALALADAIIDWRDEDNTPRPYGVENDYYITLKPPYPSKDKDFEIPEELLLVKGMTPEIYNKIKDMVTVWGDGRVNINTAPAGTLRALGLPISLVSNIYRFRAGRDGTLGTSDDNIIPKEGELVARLLKEIPLSPADIELLNGLIVSDLITAGSKYFRITARGTIHNKTREITCIIQRGGSIVFWQEK